MLLFYHVPQEEARTMQDKYLVRSKLYVLDEQENLKISVYHVDDIITASLKEAKAYLRKYKNQYTVEIFKLIEAKYYNLEEGTKSYDQQNGS